MTDNKGKKIVARVNDGSNPGCSTCALGNTCTDVICGICVVNDNDKIDTEVNDETSIMKMINECRDDWNMCGYKFE